MAKFLNGEEDKKEDDGWGLYVTPSKWIVCFRGSYWSAA
jgi:hypothetical protein